MTGSSALLDRDVLDQLLMRARSHPLVAAASFDRSGGTIRSLVLNLDAGQYPDAVADATLTVRWFENDEYCFHYRERHPDESSRLWECRWDRHPNPHADYEHFHEPPRAADDAVDDPVDAPHPTAMLTRTLANVEDRVEALWSDG